MQVISSSACVAKHTRNWTRHRAVQSCVESCGCNDFNIKRRMALYNCDVERRKDLLYRILVCEWSDEIHTIFRGVTSLIQSRVQKHPELDFVLANMDKNRNMQRACILHALSLEPEFQQYIISHNNSCSNTISEFIHKHLHANVEQLLNGCISMDYFVNDCAVAYISM